VDAAFSLSISPWSSLASSTPAQVASLIAAFSPVPLAGCAAPAPVAAGVCVPAGAQEESINAITTKSIHIEIKCFFILGLLLFDSGRKYRFRLQN
jgi:hypothetical protein